MSVDEALLANVSEIINPWSLFVDDFDRELCSHCAKVTDGVPLTDSRIGQLHLNRSCSCHGCVMLTVNNRQGAAVRYVANVSDLDTHSIKGVRNFVALVLAGTWLEMHSRLVRRIKNLLFSNGDVIVVGNAVCRIGATYKIGRAVLDGS